MEPWIEQMISDITNESTDYHEKALLQGLADLLQEQQQRITSKQGELDGKLWNPSEW
ncbi:hypothetical protein A5886_001655 [Enterococcus sp. 8G7_MSG3316]|uniref:Uncharacterized protein n=1 Tax=Candidatus Enterococcus testudinis TaxID=1834191 RepID=A0A242A6B5_9ENTE|nr:hypothetical protein [Enterococcus sp. 8G7_MSG3316]OTN76578.1 hypothetical protein A5886_001655 [Enterococcus sp. 8G7_MSG3316]